MSKHETLDKPNDQALDALQERIAYRFRDLSLLENALTHSSYIASGGKETENMRDNERLEFLGDAVLELCVTDHLYRSFDMQEGQMTRTRASAVCEDALFHVAQAIDLQDCLFLSAGESRSGGRGKASIVSDALEALLAAVYLDGGFGAAMDFVARFVLPSIETVAAVDRSDPKTRLQEWLQRDGSVQIHYAIVSEEGPAHEKTFVVAVEVDGRALGQGKGKNKKEAEQAAALCALSVLGEEPQ